HRAHRRRLTLARDRRRVRGADVVGAARLSTARLRGARQAREIRRWLGGPPVAMASVMRMLVFAVAMLAAGCACDDTAMSSPDLAAPASPADLSVRDLSPPHSCGAPQCEDARTLGTPHWEDRGCSVRIDICPHACVTAEADAGVG